MCIIGDHKTKTPNYSLMDDFNDTNKNKMFLRYCTPKLSMKFTPPHAVNEAYLYGYVYV